MTLNLLPRVEIVLLLFALIAPTRATAGPVYLYLAVDPPTTAGFGIPTIPRDYSTGSFSVTSTKSGAGTWHLYALDDVAGSLGLASFGVTLGNASGVLNRSPIVTYTNYGDADETIQESFGQAGFSDLNVRSGQGTNAPNPVVGFQASGSPQDIPGFGISASNFNNIPNNPAPGDHRVWGGTISGQWGNYATDPDPINGKNWLLLGEGNYSGQLKIGETNIYHYTSANPLRQTLLPQTSIQVFGGCTACFAPTVQDVVVNSVNSDIPGTVFRTMTLQPSTSIAPVSWSTFTFDSHVLPGGGPGTGPNKPATTFNGPNFSWNSVGSPLGTYKWLVTASNYYGSDVGSITVNITAVPEPATISLLAMTMLCAAVLPRRRPI